MMNYVIYCEGFDTLAVSASLCSIYIYMYEVIVCRVSDSRSCDLYSYH